MNVTEKEKFDLEKLLEQKTNAAKIMLTKDQAIHAAELIAERAGYSDLSSVQKKVDKALAGKESKKISLLELIKITDNATGGMVSKVVNKFTEKNGIADRIGEARKLYFSNDDAGKAALNITISVLHELGVQYTEKDYEIDPSDSIGKVRFLNQALEQLFYLPGANKHLYAGSGVIRFVKRAFKLSPVKQLSIGFGTGITFDEKGKPTVSASVSAVGQTEEGEMVGGGVSNKGVQFSKDYYGLNVGKTPSVKFGPFCLGPGGPSVCLGGGLVTFETSGRPIFADPLTAGIVGWMSAWGAYRERRRAKKENGKYGGIGDDILMIAEECVLKLPYHVGRAIYDSMKGSLYQMSEMWFNFFHPRKGYKFETDREGNLTQKGIKELYKKVKDLEQAVHTGQRHKAKAIAERLSKSNAPPEIQGYALAMKDVIDGKGDEIGKNAEKMYSAYKANPTSKEGRMAVGYLAVAGILKERSYYIDSKELQAYQTAVNERVSVVVTKHKQKQSAQKAVEDALSQKDPSIITDFLLLSASISEDKNLKKYTEALASELEKQLKGKVERA